MPTAFIDKLAFIEIRDRKVLVTQSRGKNVWYIPGGKRESGESDLEALMREVKEELTVDLLPETVKHCGTFEAQAHGKPEGTKVRMTCYTAGYQGTIAPAAEIESVEYFSYAQKHQTSPVDALIFDDLKRKNIID